MTLPERCLNFIQELGVPVTQFCKRINLSRTSLYDWKNGKIQLSAGTIKRIEEYLTKYGF